MSFRFTVCNRMFPPTTCSPFFDRKLKKTGKKPDTKEYLEYSPPGAFIII